MKTFTLFLLGFTFCLSAHGEALDAASTEALQKTQQLLSSPEQRQDYINKNGKAASADKMVDQIGGDSMAKEGVYKLAGDVFAELVKETNGDA